ncbi:hypothetical protein SRABI106_04076 [Rahnella aquatilis]|nr:hypothetical protein SRABI106_04076 [Rahnella aquatilis]
MFINNLRHTGRCRIIWYTFKHQADGSARQRAVEQIAVARYPADIGRTPVDIAIMIVKGVFEGQGRIDQITARGMQYAFRFTRGAGGIKDEKRIFCFHFFGRTICRNAFNCIMPPDVTTLFPFPLFAGAFENDGMCDAGDRRVFQRIIHILFQRNGTSGAQTFVGGNHQPGIGIDNATGNSFRGETGEDNGMHSTDTGTGQHRDSRFRYHRHVNSDNIPFLNAQAL